MQLKIRPNDWNGGETTANEAGVVQHWIALTFRIRSESCYKRGWFCEGRGVTHLLVPRFASD